MKLKFVDQPYQTEAVNSICDIFDGCELKDSLFTIDISQDLPMNEYIETEGYSYLLGHSNKLSIENDILLKIYKIYKKIMIFKELSLYKIITLLLRWRQGQVRHTYILKLY